MKTSSAFSAGEWVEVRSKEQILATLDKKGQTDGLPFMPEMLPFCGRRLKVFKRAHKTCDPPNGLGGRRLAAAVHLEGVRCDGAAHGGCQAGCLIFWKDSWLKRANGSEAPSPDFAEGGFRGAEVGDSSRCTETDVWSGTRAPGEQMDSREPIFVCQSTQMGVATEPLHWWDLRQYVEDYTSGNVSLSRISAALLFTLFDAVTTAGLGLGSALRSAYDVFQRLRGGTPYPARIGRIPPGVRTPSERINLQPGELVKVRSYDEILKTLDHTGHNRGMLFDPELVPYCGGTYRVLQRVNRIIDERTGRMQQLKNECIQLEGVVCQACYATYRRFCPRSIYPYWREIWLERVGSNSPADPS